MKSTWLAGALLSALIAAPAAAQDAPAAPSPPAEPNPVLTFFNGTELSGFVDTYYSYNFNTPSKPCATVGGVAIFNCLHNFDVAHNSFSLNLAELALEKKPTADSRAGFRIDLDYGSAAAIVAGAEPGGTPVYQNIQQAYVSYLAPAGKNGVQFDFGKFVTMMGDEVIETKDNWNYSRSLLFALAIPYYHEGMRVTYSPNDQWTLRPLVNGWNDAWTQHGKSSAGRSREADAGVGYRELHGRTRSPEQRRVAPHPTRCGYSGNEVAPEHDFGPTARLAGQGDGRGSGISRTLSAWRRAQSSGTGRVHDRDVVEPPEFTLTLGSSTRWCPMRVDVAVICPTRRSSSKRG